MFLKIYYENLIWIPIIFIFWVVIIVYSVIRNRKIQKVKEHQMLYAYVFKNYGKDCIGFYESSKLKNEFTTKNLEVCEYVQFKYTDENGQEKNCKAYDIDRLDVDWIKKQKNGVNIRVFKDIAIIDLSKADTSNVNLAEGYTGVHALAGLTKHISSTLFVNPKINECFLPYYEEFKQTEEYKLFKSKKTKQK